MRKQEKIKAARDGRSEEHRRKVQAAKIKEFFENNFHRLPDEKMAWDGKNLV